MSRHAHQIGDWYAAAGRLPVVVRLPQCPESGRKVRALACVAMGQLRTTAPQQTSSFNHLVGERE
jgi:hypothetical protein